MLCATDLLHRLTNPSGHPHYVYDKSGNLTEDRHKEMTMSYNFLNLPNRIQTQQGNHIDFLYEATGRKWAKKGTGNHIRMYIANIEYHNGQLEHIAFPDGRLVPDYDENGLFLGTYRPEYFRTDHLGNTRLTFSDFNQDMTITTQDDPETLDDETEITAEHHYYPFGLSHAGPWYASVAPENKYRYNRKEWNEDFGLNMYDYGARGYMPDLGKWPSVDILAEVQVSWSAYHYTFGSPINHHDPTGMMGRPGHGSRRRQSLFEQLEEQGAYHGPEYGQELQIEATIVNEANLSTKNIVNIAQNVSDIYQANAFGSSFFKFNILTKEEGRKIDYADEGLFIALVNADILDNLYRLPGQSRLNDAARVIGWNGVTYDSYVNVGRLTQNQGYGRDYNWAIGYVVSHEFLHQLLQKADYSVNGRTPANTIYKGHRNSPPNLNTEGKQSSILNGIARGYDPCGVISRIQTDHWSLIIQFLQNRRP